MTSMKISQLKVAFAAAVMIILGTGQGVAGGLCSYLRLSCENGRTYPICPIAVSNEGELVTGQLVLGRGRGIHIRLVPMGDGYRYIGRGIWFDGLFSQAALTLSKNTTVACTVEFDD
jgi:hypothetical protein